MYFFDQKSICAFVPVATYNLNMTIGKKNSYATLYVETYQDMKKLERLFKSQDLKNSTPLAVHH
jgi:hypothetical protein